MKWRLKTEQINCLFKELEIVLFLFLKFNSDKFVLLKYFVFCLVKKKKMEIKDKTME